MTDRYAVVGHPVTHSLSPRIHAAFAAATGQDMRYDLLPAPLDGFADTVSEFFASGGAGLNVTLPFKEAAARWVDQLDLPAGVAGAVNTIVRGTDGLRGHNTDGTGLVRDLIGNCGVSLAGARVLLLGAGGAARGVAAPLLAEAPACLIIANRTGSRARELADEVGRALPQVDVRGIALADAAGCFDVIINATSAGLGAAAGPPAIPPATARGAVCYDLIYGAADRAGDTAFCRWAAAAGARRALDGLGMLVEQAGLAFALWRGVAPATAPVLELLRRGGV